MAIPVKDVTKKYNSPKTLPLSFYIYFACVRVRVFVCLLGPSCKWEEKFACPEIILFEELFISYFFFSHTLAFFLLYSRGFFFRCIPDEELPGESYNLWKFFGSSWIGKKRRRKKCRYWKIYYGVVTLEQPHLWTFSSFRFVFFFFLFCDIYILLGGFFLLCLYLRFSLSLSVLFLFFFRTLLYFCSSPHGWGTYESAFSRSSTKHEQTTRQRNR